MSVLAAASFHPAELLGSVCYFSCFVLKLSLQLYMHPYMYMCVCVIGLVIDWFIYFYSIDIDFLFAPPPRAWEVRDNVLVFVQKLSVLPLVVHGELGLWSVGHQHQSAAARGAVEETLRTADGQVVPQVRVRCESPVFSAFYLFNQILEFFFIGMSKSCLSAAAVKTLKSRR